MRVILLCPMHCSLDMNGGRILSNTIKKNNNSINILLNKRLLNLSVLIIW